MKKTTKNKGQKSKRHKPVRSKDVPVTKGMLDRMESKLTHQIASFRLEVNSRFKEVAAQFEQVDARFKEVAARFEQVDARFEQVDARFEQVDARFEQVDARFEQVDARFEKLESKIEEVLAAIHRVGLLVEEQNARNKFVLDGYASLNDRVEKLEKKANESF